MLAQITTSLFLSITLDIRNGRPLWGMLRANEYLGPADEVRLALAQRAIFELGDTMTGSVSEKILKGATLRELDSSEGPHVSEIATPAFKRSSSLAEAAFLSHLNLRKLFAGRGVKAYGRSLGRRRFRAEGGARRLS